jgi:site-specific DNA recombinase
MPPLAIIYRRVSTDHQDNSLELQEHINAEYCRRLGLASLDQAYEDPDTSGSIWFNDRSGGCALLIRLQSGDIQHLITSKQDRLGRDTLDTISTIRKIWDLGIVPHFPAEGGAFPRTPQNELLFEIKASVAQYERNLIRERTRSVLRRKFDLGQLTGNVPWGFDCLYTFANGDTQLSARALPPSQLPGKPLSKRLLPNYPEQATLRQMKAWRDQGWKLEEIADELNRQGICSKLGCRWQAGNVASVLQSRHTARILQTPASESQSEAA